LPRRFVFLDRDGTLVRDPGYLHRIGDYALLPGVIEGLKRLQEAGFGLAIVTNQSGIGRGIFSESTFLAFQEHLLGDLARAGIRIESTYFCPHLPEQGCACRKPSPGMLERAARELDASLPQSWVIGDSERDGELAARAGCRAVLLTREAAARSESTLFAPDLERAAALIVAENAGR
jgi:D-glycero-D-manno-heptose 1,7-bisphosphate phosphatase